MTPETQRLVGFVLCGLPLVAGAAYFTAWRPVRSLRLPRLRLRRPQVTERQCVQALAFAHLVALWIYGLCNWLPGTLLVSVVYLMVTLHFWEKK
jgi:hypothetical protein